MLVDAHCHLIGSHLEGNSLEALLDRARQVGVGGFIVAGTGLEDSAAYVEMARCHHDIRACVGVHPHDASSWDSSCAEKIASLAEAPEVVFIGETGLDWHYDFSPREAQELAFREQIRLARRVKKPLMIHTRSAREATLAILREEGGQEVGGVFHCFSEDLDFAQEAVALGFHLSFSGLITFKTAEAIREAAQWAPAERILVETDTPYLAPVPHRGKRNEPAHVVLVAQALADLRGISVSDLSELTTRNLEALCGWAPSC